MIKKSDLLVFDASSVRHFDENGNLHVAISPLTRVQVAPYYGFEVPDWERFGLDPKKIYYGYRCAEELSKPETVSSVQGIPIQLRHHADYPDAPAKDTRVGSTGDNAKFEEPYLYCSLHIQDQTAINHINDGSMRELSLGYAYEPDFTAGTTESGQKYDFIMRDIRANHLALVENGRGGPSVLVLDHSLNDAIKKQEKSAMRKSKKVLATDGDPILDKDVTVQETEQEKEDLLNPDQADQNVATDDEVDPVVATLVDAGVDPEKAGELTAKLKELIKVQAVDEDPNDNVPSEDAEPEEKATDEEPLTSDEEGDKQKQGKDVVADGLNECGYDDANEEVQKAFADGVKYGEGLVRNPDEREKIDAEHEAEGEKKALGEDSAKYIMRMVEKRISEKFNAADECVRSLGKIRPAAYDSAGAIYLDALKAEGYSVKGLTAQTARNVYLGFMSGKNKVRGLAQDSALKKQAPSAISSILNNVNKGY